MPLYECVFIARQDISAEQAEALAGEFSNIITGQGGQVPKKEYWGLRNLAFKIKKNRKGHYTLLNIDAAPPAVHEMERQMRLHEDVLRLLTVRVDALEEGPSAVMQRGRDERPHREGRDRDRGDRDRGDRDRDRGPRPRRDGGDEGGARTQGASE